MRRITRYLKDYAQTNHHEDRRSSTRADERQSDTGQWNQVGHRHDISQHMRSQPADHARYHQPQVHIVEVISLAKHPHDQESKRGDQAHCTDEAQRFANYSKDRIVDRLR